MTFFKNFRLQCTAKKWKFVFISSQEQLDNLAPRRDEATDILAVQH